MRFDLTVSEFTRQLHAGEKLSLYDFNTWRPYCHIVDISRAIVSVLEADRTLVGNQVLNVGDNSQHYTKKQLVETIANIVCRGEVDLVQDSVDPRNYRVSFDRVRSLLGFEISHTIPQSICSLKRELDQGCFADYEDRLEFYRNHEISTG